MIYNQRSLLRAFSNLSEYLEILRNSVQPATPILLVLKLTFQIKFCYLYWCWDGQSLLSGKKSSCHSHVTQCRCMELFRGSFPTGRRMASSLPSFRTLRKIRMQCRLNDDENERVREELCLSLIVSITDPVVEYSFVPEVVQSRPLLTIQNQNSVFTRPEEEQHRTDRLYLS